MFAARLPFLVNTSVVCEQGRRQAYEGFRVSPVTTAIATTHRTSEGPAKPQREYVGSLKTALQGPSVFGIQDAGSRPQIESGKMQVELKGFTKPEAT